MKREVIEILEDLGFEVQETSYGHLLTNKSMVFLKTVELPNNDAGNIMRHFPNLFAVHRKAEPAAGIFFAVLSDKKRGIPRAAQKVYRKYFPRRLMVISEGEKGELRAKWFQTEKKPKAIIPFIKKEIGLQQ